MIYNQGFMVCIHLTGIRGYGYVGYLPEEKVVGQWCEVDLKLWVDLADAAKTDAIKDTVDYRSVISLVQNLLKTSKFDLLEKQIKFVKQMSIFWTC